jgi:hypothetical protein
MANFSERRRSRQRAERRLRPCVDDAGQGSGSLDRRVLLSGGARLLEAVEHKAALHAASSRAKHRDTTAQATKRLTPIQEINSVYTQFQQGFNTQLDSYVASLSESSTGTTTVTAVVTSAYTAGSATMEVDDASVFGPSGAFPSPVLATASIGTAPPFGQFTLTGRSGNTLTLDLSNSTSVNLQIGTVLTATVSTSASSSAASIFPSYITNSTVLMAITLVKYFNSLPVVLPKENAPPHTPDQHGAIQKYVYQTLASTNANSLQTLLLGITLPTTPGSDLDIYNAAVASALQFSRLQLIDGISQIYSRNLLISATAPANRLGETFNTGTGSSTGSTTSTSGGSSTTA